MGRSLSSPPTPLPSALPIISTPATALILSRTDAELLKEIVDYVDDERSLAQTKAAKEGQGNDLAMMMMAVTQTVTSMSEPEGTLTAF